MATKLTKPVSRETDVLHQGRTLLATLSPEGLILREKGRRKGYLLPFGHAFIVAARLEADSMRATRPRRVSRSLLRGR